MTVRVIGFRDSYTPDEVIVNTTSRSPDPWSKGLSPFFLGPIPLYDGMISQNLENAWQYSKVYAEYLDSEGNPSPEYFEWAKAGWAKKEAVRYPMGKGAKPSFSWWEGKPLSYIEARKKIYIPLYAHAVVKTQAFEILKQRYIENKYQITLWDFDGYDHRSLGMSWSDVIHNDQRSMGHAFVIAMLLEKLIL